MRWGLRPLAVLLGLAFAAAASAQIYRWVDAQGRTHFTDSPPAGTAASKVPVVPAPPASLASRPGVVEQARRLAAEREQAEAEQAVGRDREQDANQARRRACAKALEQLGTVRRGGPVVSTDNPAITLPDDHRDAEIARLQAEAARHCNGVQAAEVAPALQREEERAARHRECVRARDALGLLEAPGARAVGSDLEAGRARVRRYCD
jgi:hypothetical protein